MFVVWGIGSSLTHILCVLFYLFFIYRFFRQFLLFFFLHQMSLALFRLMGALGRNMIVANTFGSFAMLIVMVLGGYIVSRGKTKSPLWMLWCFFSPGGAPESFTCSFHFIWDRQNTKLVDLGFLDFTTDVCSRCGFCEWISWSFLGQSTISHCQILLFSSQSWDSFYLFSAVFVIVKLKFSLVNEDIRTLLMIESSYHGVYRISWIQDIYQNV